MRADDKPTTAEFADVWRTNRSYLVGLAFGMLGDISAAEDAVQEAYGRLADTPFDRIEDARGWLTVVTSRICIDQLRSARSRRELTHDSSTIESVGASLPRSIPVDPADRVTLDDEVRLALLVVLQCLSPIERVAFVLHDVFRLPFEVIAETVGRPASTCRQLARRARLKIESDTGRSKVEVDAAENRAVAERFIQACSNGDMSELVTTLAPDVWGTVELGPDDARTGRVNRGQRLVAENVLRFLGAATMVSNPIGGRTIVLAFVERELVAIIWLAVENARIETIRVLADPKKMYFLATQLSAAVAGDAS